MKKGYRPGGARIKRPDAAGNAIMRHKLHGNTGHGGYSNLLHARIDRRSKPGRMLTAIDAALTAHLGGADNITAPVAILKEHACRLVLLAHTAWANTVGRGTFRQDGSPVPALDVYHRTVRELRSVLETLGLERHERDVPTLAGILAGEKPRDE